MMIFLVVNVSKPFLHTCNDFSMLHPEQLILMDKCILPHMFDITCLTSFVPSWVTSRTSHLSFMELHCDTLKNSWIFKTKVIIPFTLRLFNNFIINNTIHNNIPNTMINWLNKDFHPYFQKLIVHTTKNRRRIDWDFLCNWKFVFRYRIKTLVIFKNLLLISIGNFFGWVQEEVSWTILIFLKTEFPIINIFN